MQYCNIERVKYVLGRGLGVVSPEALDTVIFLEVNGTGLGFLLDVGDVDGTGLGFLESTDSSSLLSWSSIL